MRSTRQFAMKTQELKDATLVEIEDLRRKLKGPLSEEEKGAIERRLGEIIRKMEEKKCGLTGEKSTL